VHGGFDVCTVEVDGREAGVGVDKVGWEAEGI